MPTDPPPTEPAARLSRSEHGRIFREEILPDLAADQQPQQQPLAVLLGGQPGIGKSSTKDAIVSALGPHGGVLDFSADLLRPYHPRFHELLDGDERALGDLDAAIDQDARQWVDAMIDHALTHRLNAIVDSNLASPERARGFIDLFDQAGYRVEVQFVAGPAALSRLGVLQRYQAQVELNGSGAYCSIAIQERNYTGVLQTAAMLDESALVDRVAVSRRGGATLHAQDRVEGQWLPGAGAVAAIEAERARTWNDSERSWFFDSTTAMMMRLAPGYLPDLHAACELARPLIGSQPHEQLEQLLTTISGKIAYQRAARAVPRADSPTRPSQGAPQLSPPRQDGPGPAPPRGLHQGR